MSPFSTLTGDGKTLVPVQTTENCQTARSNPAATSGQKNCSHNAGFADDVILKRPL
ncbi:hypothetical protein ACPOL_4214 [Acidisarcina polymorpha]|uniref:Uncharacterized protein n=1 Tax=Acidisarcina polymorpha TaxID=2211140 RepID=A0A2Z5G2Y6_9BACT|nr:hypothetical protein ACPOL_4214 [Acidisarcina polymorpha]